MLFSACSAPNEGYVSGDHDIGDLASTGWQDCAAKCGADPHCAAWTLLKESNHCWLKTEGYTTGTSEDWLWGLPCRGSAHS